MIYDSTYHYINPKLSIYTLHILQSQPMGFQYLILDLNSCRELETFIESGTDTHILGPLKDNESELCLIVFSFLVQRNILYIKNIFNYKVSHKVRS